MMSDGSKVTVQT